MSETLRPAPGLLTYEDAAAQLQVSTRTLRKAVAVRELGCVKLGRSVRFRQEQLDKWVQRNTVTTRRGAEKS